MKIKTVSIHNFRSIKDITLNPKAMSVLLGANNAGKTNVIMALREFYEDEKYNEDFDFPKFSNDKEESWIDVEFILTATENDTLDSKYRNAGNILKLRKYFKSETNVASGQSNLYAYEDGKFSNNLFYGWKTKGQSKLGNILYIPAVMSVEETLKLSGPSPFRSIITFVMKKVVNDSSSYEELNTAFEAFNERMKLESSNEGFSINKFKQDLNENLKDWEIEFNLNINTISPEEIIKGLVSYETIDKNLKKDINLNNLGQGLQRHLIYTLIRLSTQYTEKREYKKKEFSPEFTLILFEEPEAFLHPSQQEILNKSLVKLSSEGHQQIIVSTHSPFFVSKNIDDISSLIKLKREHGVTDCFQVSDQTRNKLLQDNNELAQFLQEKLKDASCTGTTRIKIEQMMQDTDHKKQIEEEAIRYLLWLNSERCCAFFADMVLICEGATEKIFLEYLIKNVWTDFREKKLFILDSLGKYNIHRYMNLFNELGVKHSVLADKDEDANIHAYVNAFIEGQRNSFTKQIDFFDSNIEGFLGIPNTPKNRLDKKPLNVMWHYSKNMIPEIKIGELRAKVERLM